MATNGDIVYLCKLVSKATNFQVQDVLLSAMEAAEGEGRAVAEVLEDWRKMGFRANSVMTVRTSHGHSVRYRKDHLG